MGYSINIIISLVILMGTIVIIYLVLEIRRLCGRSQEEEIRDVSKFAVGSVKAINVSRSSDDSMEKTLEMDVALDRSALDIQYAKLEIDAHIKTNIQDNPYIMEKHRVTIGRRTDNDIVIQDPTVSRQHCAVTYENGVYFIEDLGTTNGTFVDGKKVIQKAFLNKSCKIMIGDASIHFYALDSY